MARKGLGRGLDSLIPGGEAKEKQDKPVKKTTKANTKTAAKAPAKKTVTVAEKPVAERFLRVSEIEPNRGQPRKYFDEEALNELADSIKNFGIIQPIVVQKRDNYYEIIAGERRWRAAKLAKLKEVPVIIKDYTDREIMEIALIENIQREDLNPIEEAESYNKLIEEHDLLQDELAKRLSKSRSVITNSMRLLKLCDEVRDMVRTGELSGSHARTLVPVEDKEVQLFLAKEIVAKKISVRETEKLVKQTLNPPKKKEEKVDPQVELAFAEIEERLRNITGTNVKILRGKKGKGKIEIEYYSNEELDRIIDIISGN